MDISGLPYALVSMRIEDVPTVTEVERDVFSLPWSSSAFTYEIRDNPSSEYLVLRYLPWADPTPAVSPVMRSVRRLFKPAPAHDRSLLGYGGYWMMLEEAHICTLALRQEWRGRGLGELLLAGLIESALKRQAEIVTLEVRVSNLRAQRLYAKYGFDQVGQRKRYYSDNGEDAFIMSTGSIVSTAYQERLQHLAERLRARLLGESHQPPASTTASTVDESLQRQND